ncbi:hypothetical protein ACHAP8_007800 [Fusarium lateritium]
MKFSGKQESDVHPELSSFTSPTTKWTRSAISLFPTWLVIIESTAFSKKQSKSFFEKLMPSKRLLGTTLEVEVVTLRERVLGAEHPETISAIANLATTYMSLHRFREAEDMDTQAKTVSERVLGAEQLEVKLVRLRQKVLNTAHSDTRNAMGCLIVTYRLQGQFTKADELEAELMAILDMVNDS